MNTPAKSEKDRVVIFDTTLRDGEQCPGATMTHEEKLEVAELLDQMGVDIIEAGFPVASEGDFAAVHEIAKRTKNAVVCGLSRAAFKDIDRCAEAIKPAKRSRIHTFLSTSPVHMKYKLQKEPQEVYEMVIASGHPRAQLHRRRGMVERGRHPHRARLPLPLRRSRDQCRRHHHQHPRHRRLHGAGRVFRAHQDDARARAERRQGALLRALPRRSRHGGGELARRRARRHPPDRMHHQRHRRARRQRRARGGRDGDEGAQRRAAVLDQCRHARCSRAHRSWCRPRPRSRCSTTRRSSGATRSRTSPASTRTACSSTPRPTRS